MQVCDKHGEIGVAKSKPNNITYKPIIHERYLYMEIRNVI